jgi:hypothetical protein
LANLSLRARVGTGETVSAGFVVAGTETRRLLVRAVGPGLAGFGVADTLARPQLRILRGSEVIATNAGLASSGAAAEITRVAQEVGAFALGATALDAAVVATLSAGAYAVEVTGVAGSTGQVLVELYDGELTAVPTRIVNFSGRVAVAPGERAMLGFGLSGTGPRRVLLRAVGPTLRTAFGITPAFALPQLTVRQGSTVVAENARWSSGAGAAEIARVAGEVGAFALPATSDDAAVLVTLQAGTFSVDVGDLGGSGGAVMLEVYEVPEK